MSHSQHTPTSFEEQLLAMQTPLMRYALSLTADINDAQDLLQETTTRLLAQQEKFEQGSSFSAWSSTVMYNLFVSNYRKQQLTSQLISYQADYPTDQGDPLPEGGGDARELYQEIESLPPLLRKPLELFIAGYKYREIALRMDIPIGTVKSRINAARRQLRRQLDT